MNKINFSKKIISWYEEHKRDLPWRHTNDAYRIWLAEIILQQTRVAQGLPYYNRFIENFPDVISLANAKEDRVLRLWQGLGYYSRARNLHACARKIRDELNGQFPKTYQELIKLPGIGSYTAAAIASFAFREPVAVVDGNVFRVLARIFGLDYDISGNAGKLLFFEKANELIDPKQPDTFNQAVMEFGALHCTPQNPKCDSCVFAKSCVAYHNNLQQLLPVKTKKQTIRKRYFTYIVVESKGRLLMKKRTEGDIWSGLYDFYLNESESRLPNADTLLNKMKLPGKIEVSFISSTYKHVLSHQHLMTRFVWIKVKDTKSLSPWIKKNMLKFYSKDDVLNLPKPILVMRFLKEFGYLV